MSDFSNFAIDDRQLQEQVHTAVARCHSKDLSYTNVYREIILYKLIEIQLEFLFSQILITNTIVPTDRLLHPLRQHCVLLCMIFQGKTLLYYYYSVAILDRLAPLRANIISLTIVLFIRSTYQICFNKLHSNSSISNKNKCGQLVCTQPLVIVSYNFKFEKLISPATNTGTMSILNAPAVFGKVSNK